MLFFLLDFKRSDRVLAVGVPPTLVLFSATPPQTQYREQLYINGTLYLINQNIYSLSRKFKLVIQPFFICANPSIYLYGLKSNVGNIYSYFHFYFVYIHRHNHIFNINSYFHFYRARVRSLGMLVSNSLTDSLLFSKLD